MLDCVVQFEQIEKMCSTVSFIPDRKLFWREGSTIAFSSRKHSRRFARILWKSLGKTEVRAIG